MKQSLTNHYRISEETLDLRKQFIRFGAKEIRTLSRLVGWSKRVAPQIAREFYDHQFAFPPSRAFFEAQARKMNLSLDTLRQYLEGAQAGYLQQIFAEAATNGKFGRDYFEQRLKVGCVHSLIGLPPKWYIGSYTLYSDLVRKHLIRSYFYRPAFAAAAQRAVTMVFNYDIQAICDAFTLDLMETAGMDLVNVDVKSGRDLTEYISEIRTAFAEDIEAIGESLSTGDMTHSIVPCSEKDIVRRSLAQIVAQLCSMLRQVNTSAVRLHGASSELLNSAEHAGQVTAQISTAIQEMAIGITQQAASTERAALSVHELGRFTHTVATGAATQATASQQATAIASEIDAKVRQVAASAQTGAMRALESSQQAKEGARTVDANVQVMSRIKQKVGISAAKVMEMGKHSDEIGAIVETIEDIAGQTNLLALNAAIEAARAGEHGKGFAVVADEVRKLAEKSTLATRQISDLIQGIQTTVSDAVAAMKEGAEEVEAGMAGTAQAGEVFAGILQAVEVVQQQVESIASAAQHMSGSSAELTTAMQSLSDEAAKNQITTTSMQSEVSTVTGAMEQTAGITQESSAGAEQVSAATSDMSTHVGEVSASARALKDLAQLLSEQVSQFHLPEETPVTKQPAKQRTKASPPLRLVGGRR